MYRLAALLKRRYAARRLGLELQVARKIFLRTEIRFDSTNEIESYAGVKYICPNRKNRPLLENHASIL